MNALHTLYFLVYRCCWQCAGGLLSQDWKELSNWSQCDHWTRRGGGRWGVHQEVYHPAGSHHPLPHLAGELYYWLEMHCGTVGKSNCGRGEQIQCFLSIHLFFYYFFRDRANVRHCSFSGNQPSYVVHWTVFPYSQKTISSPIHDKLHLS